MIGEAVSTEKAELLETLARQRGFLRHTVRDLTDEQARLRPTVSALCLGGLVKHVTATEKQWADFAVRGAAAMGNFSEMSEEAMAAWAGAFDLVPGETLAGVLAAYERVAAETERVVAGLDLDVVHPLPVAPWFEPGATWSVRRVLLHLIAETSQHSGHADIIRETIDGSRTMG